MAALVWFRNDLRLADNPALSDAVSAGAAVVPVYVHAPDEEGGWPPGAASRWWLHHALQALDGELRRHGSRLLIAKGPTLPALRRLIAATGARRICWNRRYEPAASERDEAVRIALERDGIEVKTSNGALLVEPADVTKPDGTPFRVFTPFWRRVLGQLDPSAPLAPPVRIPAPPSWPESLSVEALQLIPQIPWYGGIAAAWRPGERAAHERLQAFAAAALATYAGQRERPDLDGTSRLSPHLHFGEISPRQVWAAVLAAAAADGRSPEEVRHARFLTEIGWREFAYYLLWHFPHTPEQPLRAEFERFPWREDTAALKAWQRGQTGVPLVDAGMRQLWNTGWMHNRLRMIVASFLVKNLRLPWQEGARWFWDTLVDADLASNTLGWQWAAGCGADAAPYFRVFNPVTQGRRFDPDGAYVRQFIPELSRLPTACIHAPWEATAAELAAAGIRPGRDYPMPIVDLRASRAAALAAFRSIRT